jgi:hypothetical protein
MRLARRLAYRANRAPDGLMKGFSALASPRGPTATFGLTEAGSQPSGTKSADLWKTTIIGAIDSLVRRANNVDRVNHFGRRLKSAQQVAEWRRTERIACDKCRRFQGSS